MSKHRLFDLYEKLYFHEIDVRDKLFGRLQTPMAIGVALTGVLAYLLQNFVFENWNSVLTVFVCLFAASCINLGFAGWFFVKSWIGNTYEFLPSADATEKYWKILQETYEKHKGGDVLAEKYLNDYLCTTYIKCATKNTESNDRRTLYLHKTNRQLIHVTVLTFSTCLVFFTGDLDKKKAEKPTEVIIVNPVDFKGTIVNEEKPESKNQTIQPPPPPPPPPTRLINEGVEIIKPQTEKKNDK
jgi:hypothetical protein